MFLNDGRQWLDLPLGFTLEYLTEIILTTQKDPVGIYPWYRALATMLLTRQVLLDCRCDIRALAALVRRVPTM